MSFVLNDNGIRRGDIIVRLAHNKADIEAAQRLRYQVFYEECGAKPSPDDQKLKREVSSIDDSADHLIVTDMTRPEGDQVVGNYRLMRRTHADRYGQFYSASEYDISSLLESSEELLEMGRTCIHKLYRTKLVLELLWQGLATYITHYKTRYLFGCASFIGTINPDDIAEKLSYLHHHHLAPPSIRARTLDDFYVDMNLIEKDEIEPKIILNTLPTLMKSYLRAGGKVSDGAFIDHQFNAIDVFMTFDVMEMKDQFKRHYKAEL